MPKNIRNGSQKWSKKYIKMCVERCKIHFDSLFRGRKMIGFGTQWILAENECYPPNVTIFKSLNEPTTDWEYKPRTLRNARFICCWTMLPARQWMRDQPNLISRGDHSPTTDLTKKNLMLVRELLAMPKFIAQEIMPIFTGRRLTK